MKTFKRILITSLAVFIALPILLSDLLRVKDSLAASLRLPEPGQYLPISEKYSDAVLRGIKLNPNEPLKINFIFDSFDQSELDREQIQCSIEYFLAGLATDEKNLWVNLSPYESDRIIEDNLSQTELGKTLLSQDYLLKQFSTSLTSPETELGNKYWKRLDVKSDTYSKVWILPESAKIYTQGTSAYVTQASLDVKIEEDYLAQEKNATVDQNSNQMRELIIPKIKDEVNHGKHFSQLRQMYSALILAKWFKQKFKQSFFKHYINSDKLGQVSLDDKDLKDKVFNLYVQAFKKGTYDLIKKETNQDGKLVKRHYFAGGNDFTNIPLENSGIDDVSAVGQSFMVSSSLTPQQLNNGFLIIPADEYKKELWDMVIEEFDFDSINSEYEAYLRLGQHHQYLKAKLNAFREVLNYGKNFKSAISQIPNYPLAQGGFATVAKFTYNNKDYVLRRETLDLNDPTSAAKIFTGLRAFMIQKDLSDYGSAPSVFNLDVQITGDYVTMEQISSFGGYNYKQVRARSSGYTQTDGLKHMLDLAAGLDYLHHRKLVFADLKETNIVVGADGKIRLIDFDMTKYKGHLAYNHSTGKFLGTPYILDPVLAKRAMVRPENDVYFDTASDVFAFGLLIYYSLTGEHLYGLNVADLPARKPWDQVKGKLANVENERIRKLLEEMLDPEAYLRPRMSEVLKVLRMVVKPKTKSEIKDHIDYINTTIKNFKVDLKQVDIKIKKIKAQDSSDYKKLVDKQKQINKSIANLEEAKLDLLEERKYISSSSALEVFNSRDSSKITEFIFTDLDAFSNDVSVRELDIKLGNTSAKGTMIAKLGPDHRFNWQILSADESDRTKAEVYLREYHSKDNKKVVKLEIVSAKGKVVNKSFELDINAKRNKKGRKNPNLTIEYFKPALSKEIVAVSDYDGSVMFKNKTEFKDLLIGEDVPELKDKVIAKTTRKGVLRLSFEGKRYDRCILNSDDVDEGVDRAGWYWRVNNQYTSEGMQVLETQFEKEGHEPIVKTFYLDKTKTDNIADLEISVMRMLDAYQAGIGSKDVDVVSKPKELSPKEEFKNMLIDGIVVDLTDKVITHTGSRGRMVLGRDDLRFEKVVLRDREVVEGIGRDGWALRVNKQIFKHGSVIFYCQFEKEGYAPIAKKFYVNFNNKIKTSNTEIIKFMDVEDLESLGIADIEFSVIRDWERAKIKPRKVKAFMAALFAYIDFDDPWSFEETFVDEYNNYWKVQVETKEDKVFIVLQSKQNNQQKLGQNLVLIKDGSGIKFSKLGTGKASPFLSKITDYLYDNAELIDYAGLNQAPHIMPLLYSKDYLGEQLNETDKLRALELTNEFINSKFGLQVKPSNFVGLLGSAKLSHKDVSAYNLYKMLGDKYDCNVRTIYKETSKSFNAYESFKDFIEMVMNEFLAVNKDDKRIGFEDDVIELKDALKYINENYEIKYFTLNNLSKLYYLLSGEGFANDQHFNLEVLEKESKFDILGSFNSYRKKDYSEYEAFVKTVEDFVYGLALMYDPTMVDVIESDIEASLVLVDKLIKRLKKEHSVVGLSTVAIFEYIKRHSALKLEKYEYWYRMMALDTDCERIFSKTAEQIYSELLAQNDDNHYQAFIELVNLLEASDLAYKASDMYSYLKAMATPTYDKYIYSTLYRYDQVWKSKGFELSKSFYPIYNQVLEEGKYQDPKMIEFVALTRLHEVLLEYESQLSPKELKETRYDPSRSKLNMKDLLEITELISSDKKSRSTTDVILYDNMAVAEHGFDDIMFSLEALRDNGNLSEMEFDVVTDVYDGLEYQEIFAKYEIDQEEFQEIMQFVAVALGDQAFASSALAEVDELKAIFDSGDVDLITASIFADFDLGDGDYTINNLDIFLKRGDRNGRFKVRLGPDHRFEFGPLRKGDLDDTSGVKYYLSSFSVKDGVKIIELKCQKTDSIYFTRKFVLDPKFFKRIKGIKNKTSQLKYMHPYTENDYLVNQISENQKLLSEMLIDGEQHDLTGKTLAKVNAEGNMEFAIGKYKYKIRPYLKEEGIESSDMQGWLWKLKRQYIRDGNIFWECSFEKDKRDPIDKVFYIDSKDIFTPKKYHFSIRKIKPYIVQTKTAEESESSIKKSRTEEYDIEGLAPEDIITASDKRVVTRYLFSDFDSLDLDIKLNDLNVALGNRNQQGELKVKVGPEHFYTFNVCGVKDLEKGEIKKELSLVAYEVRNKSKFITVRFEYENGEQVDKVFRLNSDHTIELKGRYDKTNTLTTFKALKEERIAEKEIAKNKKLLIEMLTGYKKHDLEGRVVANINSEGHLVYNVGSETFKVRVLFANDLDPEASRSDWQLFVEKQYELGNYTVFKCLVKRSGFESIPRTLYMNRFEFEQVGSSQLPVRKLSLKSYETVDVQKFTRFLEYLDQLVVSNEAMSRTVDFKEDLNKQWVIKSEPGLLDPNHWTVSMKLIHKSSRSAESFNEIVFYKRDNVLSYLLSGTMGTRKPSDSNSAYYDLLIDKVSSVAQEDTYARVKQNTDIFYALYADGFFRKQLNKLGAARALELTHQFIENRFSVFVDPKLILKVYGKGSINEVFYSRYLDFRKEELLRNNQLLMMTIKGIKQYDLSNRWIGKTNENGSLVVRSNERNYEINILKDENMLAQNKLANWYVKVINQYDQNNVTILECSLHRARSKAIRKAIYIYNDVLYFEDDYQNTPLKKIEVVDEHNFNDQVKIDFVKELNEVLVFSKARSRKYKFKQANGQEYTVFIEPGTESETDWTISIVLEYQGQYNRTFKSLIVYKTGDEKKYYEAGPGKSLNMENKSFLWTYLRNRIAEQATEIKLTSGKVDPNLHYGIYAKEFLAHRIKETDFVSAVEQTQKMLNDKFDHFVPVDSIFSAHFNQNHFTWTNAYNIYKSLVSEAGIDVKNILKLVSTNESVFIVYKNFVAKLLVEISQKYLENDVEDLIYDKDGKVNVPALLKYIKFLTENKLISNFKFGNLQHLFYCLNGSGIALNSLLNYEYLADLVGFDTGLSFKMHSVDKDNTYDVFLYSLADFVMAIVAAYEPEAYERVSMEIFSSESLYVVPVANWLNYLIDKYQLKGVSPNIFFQYARAYNLYKPEKIEFMNRIFNLDVMIQEEFGVKLSDLYESAYEENSNHFYAFDDLMNVLEEYKFNDNSLDLYAYLKNYGVQTYDTHFYGILYCYYRTWDEYGLDVIKDYFSISEQMLNDESSQTDKDVTEKVIEKLHEKIKGLETNFDILESKFAQDVKYDASKSLSRLRYILSAAEIIHYEEKGDLDFETALIVKADESSEQFSFVDHSIKQLNKNGVLNRFELDVLDSIAEGLSKEQILLELGMQGSEYDRLLAKVRGHLVLEDINQDELVGSSALNGGIDLKAVDVEESGTMIELAEIDIDFSNFTGFTFVVNAVNEVENLKSLLIN